MNPTLRIFKNTLTLSFLFFCFASFAFGQQENKPLVNPKFGKGIQITDPNNTLHLKFEARFQTLYRGDYYMDDSSYDSEFMIRRSRLKFSGFVYNPNIEYKIELGFSNRDIQVRGRESDYANVILDAYMRVKLAKNLKLRVGQFKLPGNRERVVSSGSLQLVDRSLVNSRFNIDRDAGVMLEHKMKIRNAVVKEMFAVSTGEGRNRLGNDDGMMYTGRVELLPMGEFQSKGDYVMSSIKREKTPKLALGFTASYNDNAKRSRGQLGGYLYEQRDLLTYNADMMFKWMGFSAYAEYGNRMADSPVTTDAEGKEVEYVYVGKGYNAQAGYMFKNNWEIAARYTSLSPEDEIGQYTDDRTDYTFGFSKFIVGHNLKVQADITYSETQPIDVSRNPSQTMVFRVTTNLNF